MQLDAFMKIEGPPLNGESTDDKNLNSIEILSFEQQIQRPLPDGSSTGQQSTADLSPVVVLKQLDKATPKLMEAAAKGTIYDKFTLSLYQPTGTADVAISSWDKAVYYEVVIEKVRITGIRWIGDPALHDSTLLPAGGSLGPCEELELTFRKIGWMYQGGTGTANISGSWNKDTAAPT